MALLRKRWLCRVDGFEWFRAAFGFLGPPSSVLVPVIILMSSNRWEVIGKYNGRGAFWRNREVVLERVQEKTRCLDEVRRI